MAGQTQHLRAVEAFQDLTDAELEELAARLELVSLQRGEALVREGEDSDALFIALSGRFIVTVTGRAVTVAEIGPGRTIGEIAFFAGGKRTATVTAARDSLALRLSREDFERLCERSPAIWRTIMATLAQRLAEATRASVRRAHPRPSTIALIPAGGAAALPARFVETLTAVLARDHSTLLVRSETLAAHLPAGVSLASVEATRAMNELEGRYEMVLYLADPALTPWSQKAVHQADMVMLVGLHRGHESDPVPPTPLEQLAFERHGEEARRLVLLHARQRPLAGTARWLEARPVRMHHHVALEDIADYERLVRFITGRALGLVACGGSAFSTAHIGMYKALREAGLCFDIMGGTSGGAAMTAGFARGETPERVEQLTHETFISKGAFRRYTWPRYALFDHTIFDAQLRHHYGTGDIEDLWIPFFSVSTNLSNYSLHRHRRGPLWAAIRASASIPALLPPYYTKDGLMLVDGCLLDNVPIQVMHEIKGGPNVVISFEAPTLERFDVDYERLPSRTDILKRAFNPFARETLPEAPSLGTVLMRSLMANRQNFERHLESEDILLVPPLPENMGVLDWHMHPELVAASYAWTRGELARLLREGNAVLKEFAAPPDGAG